MSLSSLSGVTKAWSGDPLFTDVALRLLPGQRVALVGANGSGKSTLLEIVVGLVDPDDGEVSRGSGVRATGRRHRWPATTRGRRG